MTRTVDQASANLGGKAVDYSAALDLISTTDPQSHITYANQSFCDVAGYSEEELVGNPHNLVRHGDMPKKKRLNSYGNMSKLAKAGWELLRITAKMETIIGFPLSLRQ